MLPLTKHNANLKSRTIHSLFFAKSTTNVLQHIIHKTWLRCIRMCIYVCCFAQTLPDLSASAITFASDGTTLLSADSIQVDKMDSIVVIDTTALRRNQVDSNIVRHAESAEQQVSLDSAGRIMMLNAQDVERTGLFPNIAQLKEVRLFRQRDSSYVMEFMCLNDQTLRSTRQNMSDAQVQQFRQQLQRAMQSDSTKVLNQEGRPAFLTNSLLLASLYYGPAVASLLDADEVPSFALSYFAGAIGGFTIPAILTINSEITHGQACLSRIYAEIGIIGSTYACVLIDYPHATPWKIASSGILGGVAGTILGLHLAKETNIAEGRAVAFGSLCTDGAVLSYGLLRGTGAFDQMGDREGPTLNFLLSTASFFGAWKLSELQDFTPADAHIMSIPSSVCALLAASIYSPEIEFNSNTSILVSTIGYAAGAIGGWYLVKDKAFRNEHYTKTYLASLAGTIVGIVVGIGIDKNRAISVAAATGTALGFGISAWIYSHDSGVSLSQHADETTGRNSQPTTVLDLDHSQDYNDAVALQNTIKKSPDFNLNIHPESLLYVKSSNGSQLMPLASLTLSF